MTNPLTEIFKDKTIKLVSRSPRRKELLAVLGLPFKQVDFSVDEKISEVSVSELAGKLARKKAESYRNAFPLNDNDFIITADTIVVIDKKLLGKPNDEKEAKQFLRLLSGKKHKVITGIALLTQKKTVVFQEITEVIFKELDDGEIDYYVSEFQPFDKAGAYGIQEWIGAVAVEKITGSYYNVMGLPVHRLYQEMLAF
ncbi:MAG: septum formation protein Maf [Bacteroidales bacterium]|nr:septum formation protein Maf [Bacteroidales bacterium]